MATAEFPASFVYERAVEREVELEQNRLASAERWISDYMAKERTDGALWAKKVYFPSREQAEAAYVRKPDFTGSQKYWNEYLEREGIKRLAPLQRIAAAVIQSGSDQTITLTPDDCAALDIPAGFKVIA